MFSDRTNWKLAENRFTQALELVRASGAKIHDLAVSNPTRIGLCYDQRAILAGLASPHSLDYDPQPKGLHEAREAVAAYYRNPSGILSTAEIDPEQIILTTSTSEGYAYVFRLLCNPGDELLVPRPSYPLFEFLADLQDVKLAPFPLLYDHGWQIDFLSLKRALTLRTRGIVLVHPNNPTGSYVSETERAELNRFCREHDLALIVDEVFLDYAHDGKPRPSFAANRDTLTFTLSGLSKIAALPQMKVAWIASSGPRQQAADAIARLEVISDTFLSMNAPVQWAIPALLGQRENLKDQLIRRVRENLAELDRQLAAQQSCTRLNADGGWYAVLRVPVTQPDEDLAIDLLHTESVLVHPGHFYDFPSDGFLVLSLITPHDEFLEGTARVLKYLNSR